MPSKSAGSSKSLKPQAPHRDAQNETGIEIRHDSDLLERKLPADLLGSLLGKGSRSVAQGGGGQRRFGRRSAVGARLEGLSDFYEPYLLQKKMSGNVCRRIISVQDQSAFQGDRA